MTLKIAALGHYPISTPLHGGQRRVDAISKVAKLNGYEFHHIPVFSTTGYPNASELEKQTALPKTILEKLHQPGVREDVHFAREVGEDHPLVQDIIDRLRAIAPQVIQFDQPWLFRLFKKQLSNDNRLANARIVYSSHNVEADLIAPTWESDARAIEMELALAADQVFTVSQSDAEVFDKWRGTKRRPSVVAPNGCWPPDLTTNMATDRLVEGDYAIMVGSEHPPNAKGYWECIGTFPGFLPPDASLVVAGGVNRLLRQDDRFLRFPRVNSEFVKNFGIVKEETLNSLLFHAKAICLPITEGGGTNLKTAEALMWLKPVVAMRHALRGFEEAANMDGVYVADNPKDFRRLLRDVMVGDLVSERVPETVEAYGWPAQLAPLMKAYEDLSGRT